MGDGWVLGVVVLVLAVGTEEIDVISSDEFRISSLTWKKKYTSPNQGGSEERMLGSRVTSCKYP